MQGRFHKLRYNNLTLPFRPFYRRYPYTGGLSIGSADARGCLDLALGCFYNRMPKAANSTVTTTLARLREGRDITSKVAKKLFDTPGQLRSDQMAAFDALFKFTVVRNPFTRVLSAYLDKVERPQPQALGRTGFADFISGLERGRLLGNGHWAPQRAMLLIPVERLDFIGRVETLEADLVHVQQRLCPDRAATMKSFLANATGSRDKLAQYYDASLVDRVRRLYQADFETFGYADTSPLA